MEFIVSSKKRSIVFCIVVFLLAICQPSPAVSQSKAGVFVANEIPVYNPPKGANKGNKTRMEAGGESDSGDSSATSRAPSVRGLTRAPSVRGLTRGPSIRGLTRAASVRTSGDQDEQAFTPLPSRMSPLAPENTGLTLTNQPVLQWYISDPWPDNIEFRLNRLKAPEPDIDTNIRGTDKGGIYRISLADHNVSLKPGVDYEWVLAIVNDEEERSADFTACARIRYVKPDEELSKRIMNTPKEKLYHVYADQGYWYDALENLSQLIDARPGDNTLRRHRAELFRQVGLEMEADYDNQ